MVIDPQIHPDLFGRIQIRWQDLDRRKLAAALIGADLLAGLQRQRQTPAPGLLVISLERLHHRVDVRLTHEMITGCNAIATEFVMLHVGALGASPGVFNFFVLIAISCRAWTFVAESQLQGLLRMHVHVDALERGRAQAQIGVMLDIDHTYA